MSGVNHQATKHTEWLKNKHQGLVLFSLNGSTNLLRHSHWNVTRLQNRGNARLSAFMSPDSSKFVGQFSVRWRQICILGWNRNIMLMRAAHEKTQITEPKGWKYWACGSVQHPKATHFHKSQIVCVSVQRWTQREKLQADFNIEGIFEGSEVAHRNEDTVCRPDAEQLNVDLIHFLAKQLLNSCI